MISILIVEDDKLIGSAAEQWLSQDYQVQWVESLGDARSSLKNGDFDILLLDLGLPDGNGIELFAYLSRQRIEAGVIIMTAFGEVEQRITGLNAGADDYIVKPLDFKELDARIRAVKRRKDGLSSTLVEHEDLTLDLHRMHLTQAGVPIHLSRMELSILAILLQSRNRYFSKTMLENRLYEQSDASTGNAIEVHISAIRKKLGKSLIKTTRGLGYIIEKPGMS